MERRPAVRPGPQWSPDYYRRIGARYVWGAGRARRLKLDVRSSRLQPVA